MNQIQILNVAARLYRGLPVTTRVLREHYGCSQASAKRAMRTLEMALPVVAEQDGQRTVLRIRKASGHVRPANSTTWMSL